MENLKYLEVFSKNTLVKIATELNKIDDKINLKLNREELSIILKDYYISHREDLELLYMYDADFKSFIDSLDTVSDKEAKVILNLPHNVYDDLIKFKFLNKDYLDKRIWWTNHQGVSSKSLYTCYKNPNLTKDLEKERNKLLNKKQELIVDSQKNIIPKLEDLIENTIKLNNLSLYPKEIMLKLLLIELLINSPNKRKKHLQIKYFSTIKKYFEEISDEIILIKSNTNSYDTYCFIFLINYKLDLILPIDIRKESYFYHKILSSTDRIYEVNVEKQYSIYELTSYQMIEPFIKNDSFVQRNHSSQSLPLFAFSKFFGNSTKNISFWCKKFSSIPNVKRIKYKDIISNEITIELMDKYFNLE